MRKRLPRRALLAATLGAVYALLILPAPQAVLGISWPGLAWFILSAGLLFRHPVAYHAYTFWGILWLVYLAITHTRAGTFVPLAMHAPLPLASLWLLMTSGYREVASASLETPGPQDPKTPE